VNGLSAWTRRGRSALQSSAGAAVGSAVEVPVAVTGLTPAEFLAFQFDLDYDPTVLAFVSVTRGSLIDRQQAGAAVPEYTPCTWPSVASARRPSPSL